MESFFSSDANIYWLTYLLQVLISCLRSFLVRASYEIKVIMDSESENIKPKDTKAEVGYLVTGFLQ